MNLTGKVALVTGGSRGGRRAVSESARPLVEVIDDLVGS
jgi:NAD(P)-dependent dehydrogenase (short-subunit alcohol dehydrogenase family)